MNQKSAASRSSSFRSCSRLFAGAHQANKPPTTLNTSYSITMTLLSQLSVAAVALSALPGAVAPNQVRAVIENGAYPHSAILIHSGPRAAPPSHSARCCCCSGVCYGMCGHYGGIGLTGRAEAPDYGASVQPADIDPASSHFGHAAGGDHVGPCGGEWLTDFSLEITQSCCHRPDVTATSSGEVACVCPMAITCAGMTEEPAAPTPPPPMCRPDGSRCPILLDVRTEDEWNTDGHASCAVRIPVQDDASRTSEVLALAGGDLSYPIATYCYSGARATTATDGPLASAGFTGVVASGGWVMPAGNAAVLEEMCVCDTPCAPAAPAPQTIEVGGQDGWVVKPQNAPYDDIVANVGDTISFTYSSNYHDVMLVDNENCDFSSGTLVDDTGSFSWVIPEAGTYTFVCTRGDHCSSGNQQVTVTVAGDTAAVVCVGDVVADLIIDVADLLALLGQFGQTGVNVADVSGDLLVDVTDLLTLLGQFGRTC